MVATIAAARAGATTGEWARTLREVFGSYRAPTGVGEAAAAPADGELSELRERGLAPAGEARPAAEDPRRQAGPRRPLQRRRADRRARARLGHGRGLRGHPPDARPDRRLGAAGGRARDRPVDPLRLAPRADPRRDRRAARRRRDGAGGRRRDHPRAGRRAAASRRAWPPSTRRRTSTSRASCATSSSWWAPSAEHAATAPSANGAA